MMNTIKGCIYCGFHIKRSYRTNFRSLIRRPAKRETWTDLLFDYTDKLDWSDQELEDLLKPSCPGLKNFIQNRHAISAHQLVASGLQGVWSYFVKAFLENVFLPSNAIYNVMSNGAKRYNANNAYLTLKK